uniref:Uncharacterized protein n=1 Tax=Amphimedon queenslandica TaxID=400682 RepID=A0A1X7SLV4_AMPQE
MISNDTCQDCTSTDIRLDSLILGNIANSGMITIGCVSNRRLLSFSVDDFSGAGLSSIVSVYKNTPPYFLI